MNGIGNDSDGSGMLCGKHVRHIVVNVNSYDKLEADEPSGGHTTVN